MSWNDRESKQTFGSVSPNTDLLRLQKLDFLLLACELNLDTDNDRKEVEGEMKCNVNHCEESNCLLAAGAQQHQSHLENSLLIPQIRSCYYVLCVCVCVCVRVP